MKRLLISLAVVALLASCSKQEASVNVDYADNASQSFLSLCSGLDASVEAIRTIALANCLGRTRGFIDGHQLTVKMMPSMKPMWCVKQNVTDSQLLDTIMTWYTQHPTSVKKITDDLDGINAATAVMMVAASATYPCKE